MIFVADPEVAWPRECIFEEVPERGLLPAVTMNALPVGITRIPEISLSSIQAESGYEQEVRRAFVVEAAAGTARRNMSTK